MYVVIFVFLDLSDYFVCEDLLARGEDGGGEAARVSGGGGFRKLAQNGVGGTQLYASPSQSRVIPYFSSKAWTYVGMNVNFKI